MATHRVESGPGWELHACDWRDADLPTVDMVCEDPPYGERTHAGQRHERKSGDAAHLMSTNGITYTHLRPEDVAVLVSAAHAVCPGWCLWQTSHDLIPHYEAAAASVKRYSFAPLPIVIPGMNIRLAGDGPSNWTIYMVVTRTKIKKCWGTKPGAYSAGQLDACVRGLVPGAKPLGLMEAILRDYTDPGDLVLDRFTGGGTTGVAAIRNGRRFVGYERKPEHFEIALKRLRAIREQLTIGGI